jgi:hypothetical protein
MSGTDEQINLLNFDTNRSYDSQQKSLFINNIDALSSSVTTTTQLVPVTYQNQHSITASIPYQPQLTTTINMSQNLVEQSKNALDVN